MPVSRPTLSRAVRTLFMLVIGILILDVGRYTLWPDVTLLQQTNPVSTAFMEYRRSQWARENPETRTPSKPDYRFVPLERISPDLRLAVTIAEDDKFWTHSGFDWKGMEEALRRNMDQGRLVAGGSTITQQLAKNLWLSPGRNPLRKLKEAILTWRLEHALSKRRILELYLNVAEWGDGIFGAEAAARAYFHTSAARLSRRQAAFLAAALPRPLSWSPALPSRALSARAETILRRMERRTPTSTPPPHITP